MTAMDAHRPQDQLLLTPAQTAAALGIPLRKLRTLRRQNRGPEFYRLGGTLIRYNAHSVRAHAIPRERTTENAP